MTTLLDIEYYFIDQFIKMGETAQLIKQRKHFLALKASIDKGISFEVVYSTPTHPIHRDPYAELLDSRSEEKPKEQLKGSVEALKDINRTKPNTSSALIRSLAYQMLQICDLEIAKTKLPESKLKSMCTNINYHIKCFGHTKLTAPLRNQLDSLTKGDLDTNTESIINSVFSDFKIIVAQHGEKPVVQAYTQYLNSLGTFFETQIDKLMDSTEESFVLVNTSGLSKT